MTVSYLLRISSPPVNKLCAFTKVHTCTDVRPPPISVLLLLVIAGDIQTNPGPEALPLCKERSELYCDHLRYHRFDTSSHYH